MTQINLKHLEKLAKLDLPPKEKISLEADLKKLVGRFAELAALEIKESEKTPLSKGSDKLCAKKQGLRNDEIVNQVLSIEKVLEQSPCRLGSAFGVPRVL